MTMLRRLIVTLTMLALVVVGWPGTATAGNKAGSHNQGLITFASDVTGLNQLYTI